MTHCGTVRDSKWYCWCAERRDRLKLPVPAFHVSPFVPATTEERETFFVRHALGTVRHRRVLVGVRLGIERSTDAPATRRRAGST